MTLIFGLCGCNCVRFRELRVRRLLRLDPFVPLLLPPTPPPGEDTVEEAPPPIDIAVAGDTESSILITACRRFDPMTTGVSGKGIGPSKGSEKNVGLLG